jgi:hypothetical protein
MKKFWFLLLLPLSVHAEQCVMQERTVTQSTVSIQERSPVRRDIIIVPTGRRCMVDFRVRVGATWHTAIGEYDWPGDRDSGWACAQAVTRAEHAVIERLGLKTRSEQVLVCKDRPELQELQQTHPGTVGDISQFRPHPEFPNRFWHNGAQCRWFVESAYARSDIRVYQGVVCEVQPKKWVVVDKF